MQRSILVIRLGALGDLLLARDVFHSIRVHHPHDRIVFLTRTQFAGLAKKMPWFDEVWADPSPKFWQVNQWMSLARRLRGGGFARVYDIQCNDRTGFYFRLLGGKAPEWVGTARGCSHPRPRLTGEPIAADELWFGMLAVAGIQRAGNADMSWLDGSVDQFGLPPKLVVLVPGCAPHRLYKRWPPEYYAELALHLTKQGFGVAVVGTGQDRAAVEVITRASPSVINLAERTDFGQLAAVGRKALAIVGNDTGPMHVMAAVGAQSLILMSGKSHPFVTLPEAQNVRRLQVNSLAELSVEQVLKAMPLPVH